MAVNYLLALRDFFWKTFEELQQIENHKMIRNLTSSPKEESYNNK